MTREQAKIAGAWAAGETVQFRNKIDCSKHWHDYPPAEGLSFANNAEWRIKPKAREWWICPVCCRVYVSNQSSGCRCCVAPRVHVREVLE